MFTLSQYYAPLVKGIRLKHTEKNRRKRKEKKSDAKKKEKSDVKKEKKNSEKEKCAWCVSRFILFCPTV